MAPRVATGPRSLALDVVIRVARGAYLTPALDGALRGAELSRRERALVTDLAYGAVRHRTWLDAALAPNLRDPEGLPPDVREALRMGAYERLVRGTPAHAVANEWVGEIRRRHPGLAGLANAVLRRVAPPRAPDPATAASLPPWLYARFEDLLGEDAAAATTAMRAPAPLWLLAYADDAAERLRAEGCEVTPGPLPDTLRVRPSAPLAELRAHQEGAVQPQNPASAQVARTVAPPAGTRVLDLCSGRGVKAALLAAAGADVTAVERDPGKIARAERNLARLGLRVRHHRADLRTLPAGLRPAQRVLLDAPCSGTGTLRAHPEIPLRLREDDVAGLTELQDRLLDTAASLTAPQGTLTYAVCSLLRAEGPARVEAFLARHPEFTSAPLEPPLPHRAFDTGVTILPWDGLDGFYLAQLRRAAA